MGVSVVSAASWLSVLGELESGGVAFSIAAQEDQKIAKIPKEPRKEQRIQI